MSESKDSAIKLFGKTIPLADTPVSAAASVSDRVSLPSLGPDVYEDLPSSPEDNQLNQKSDEVLSGERLSDSKHENGTQSVTSEEIADSNASAAANENTKTPSATTKSLKIEEEQSDTSNSREKTLTKPDKILPCPRCNSMDTKFCYYNNYNVNQPRHFCKNCQRYWTAGGTMRSVPVGAGRRKNKNSASPYRHITVSEALQNARSDLPNGTPHPTLKPNGTVLGFGTDSPLCESMAQVLNIAESTMRNSAQWSLAFCPPGYPMPFYSAPPPYWGCTVSGTWNVPWVTPTSSSAKLTDPSSCANLTAPSSGPNSPTLGKHSREENMVEQTSSGEEDAQKENNPERYLWIPKTLRIDDLGEAARSSIWATLGIKKHKADSVSGGGLFKAFESNGGEKNHISDTSSVLQANPAALSRSSNFHESS